MENIWSQKIWKILVYNILYCPLRSIIKISEDPCWTRDIFLETIFLIVIDLMPPGRPSIELSIAGYSASSQLDAQKQCCP